MFLEYLKIEAKLFFKYGTIYREVIHTPRIEWCGMAKDYLQPKIPTPLSVAIEIIKDSAPEAVHQCPYTVRDLIGFVRQLLEFLDNFNLFQGLNVRNRTFVPNAMKSIFPRGQYKAIFYGFGKNDDPIGAVNFILDVISSNKETFG